MEITWAFQMLSQFDPITKEHINNYGNDINGTSSYLSVNICDDFIALMGRKVLSAIVDEVLQAKHCSIIVDFTPDISHVD